MYSEPETDRHSHSCCPDLVGFVRGNHLGLLPGLRSSKREHGNRSHGSRVPFAAARSERTGSVPSASGSEHQMGHSFSRPEVPRVSFFALSVKVVDIGLPPVLSKFSPRATT